MAMIIRANDIIIYKEHQISIQMKRLTAYVSGNVQHSGYRARVTDIARMLGFKGTVENLDDGRVKIIAEGDEDKLRWFEEAICIKNSLINVSSIEKEYSSQRGDVNRFYKLVEKGETDSRLDTAADHLKSLIVAVNCMNDNLGGKIDQMNDNLSSKIDQMNDNLSSKIDQMNDNLSSKIDQMNDNLSSKIDQMNDNLSSKIDQMNDNLSSKIDQMNDNLSSKIDQMNDNLSSKIDQMNDNLSSKMDVMIDLQKDALSGQEILIEEVRQSREDIKGGLDQRFDKLESEVAEMRGALKSKGII